MSVHHERVFRAPIHPSSGSVEFIFRPCHVRRSVHPVSAVCVALFVGPERAAHDSPGLVGRAQLGKPTLGTRSPRPPGEPRRCRVFHVLPRGTPRAMRKNAFRSLSAGCGSAPWQADGVVPPRMARGAIWRPPTQGWGCALRASSQPWVFMGCPFRAAEMARFAAGPSRAERSNLWALKINSTEPLQPSLFPLFSGFTSIPWQLAGVPSASRNAFPCSSFDTNRVFAPR